MTPSSGEARIVVGVDGSVASKHALQWAADEAMYRGVGVDIIHAWKVPDRAYPDGCHIDAGRYEQEGRAILNEAVASLAESDVFPPDVRPVLCEDDAATALLRAAKTAALLVVGARGRGGVFGLLLGSVSKRCVHLAPCPVAVMTTTWECVHSLTDDRQVAGAMPHARVRVDLEVADDLRSRGSSRTRTVETASTSCLTAALPGVQRPDQHDSVGGIRS